MAFADLNGAQRAQIPGASLGLWPSQAPAQNWDPLSQSQCCAVIVSVARPVHLSMCIRACRHGRMCMGHRCECTHLNTCVSMCICTCRHGHMCMGHRYECTCQNIHAHTSTHVQGMLVWCTNIHACSCVRVDMQTWPRARSLRVLLYAWMSTR